VFVTVGSLKIILYTAKTLEDSCKTTSLLISHMLVFLYASVLFDNT
jgi:hypothetical protein